jgi:hypothetical protein
VGCIVKWSVKLGEFDHEFCSRQAIKSQILTDFVSEWTENRQPPPAQKPEHWKMYFDDSLNLEGAGAGILFISPQGDHLKYILQIHYKACNNDAEYKALIHGLHITVSLGIKRLIAYHYVKTSNRSRNICNGSLTPVTSTHICNGCCLAPVTYRRARTTPGLASTTPVTNVDFW